jgi:hypothetical protein
MITAADLIRKLETYNPDSLILLAKDTEGSAYSSLDDISVEMVEVDYDGGEVEDLFDKEALLEADPDLSSNELKNNFKEVLVFWPN